MVTLTDQEFAEITAYIKKNYGIRLGQEKRALVLGRLSKLLAQLKFNSVSEYFSYVINDKTGTASTTLVNAITTNHTYFMRETGHFDYLRQHVLPFLTATVKDRDLRIWSAGCSTGEEPYTLAMIIDEFLGPAKQQWDAKLLATDISEKALSIARTGIYKSEAIAALPAQWRVKYFKKMDKEQSVVNDRIKNEVIFRRLNLMDHRFPFKKKFHAIFCRNVMIYFDSKTRQELVQKFYDLTEDNGYLFIGHSESLGRDETRYSFIKPAVYRKERF
jgi:chemotaxis protein methyltransferase CheR